MALKLGIQTYQILTNCDEVCTPSLSSILLAVSVLYFLLATRNKDIMLLIKGILTLKITCLFHGICRVTIDIEKMAMAFRGAILRSFFSMINYVYLLEFLKRIEKKYNLDFSEN